jgi:hypothetical protein
MDPSLRRNSSGLVRGQAQAYSVPDVRRSVAVYVVDYHETEKQ